ncbi:hypothetical protein UFOVP529_77 [uncultured Caudovirales phage]|uniref:Uncharacterized protein n=1 Tax=uncultured Caudovirales phage TaxID=2100421 RepID=A0A6J5MWC3_9CAUD|nr:hypothetical protein UFOVP529_77 [uncultured Caudovirales phage]CAB4189783.1 hypothetical protein UFOVP1191_15 [uncultured Caudovirales phage]CAB4194405.1 hypothetical protein UFOVP1252_44 [uncultured Caudovirales phage]
MSERRKLGMCNYCQALGPVFEQEDAAGVPTFLICRNCITDVFVGFTVEEKRQAIRRRHNPSFNNWLDTWLHDAGE